MDEPTRMKMVFGLSSERRYPHRRLGRYQKSERISIRGRDILSPYPTARPNSMRTAESSGQCELRSRKDFPLDLGTFVGHCLAQVILGLKTD
jgi:hypothetical protein